MSSAWFKAAASQRDDLLSSQLEGKDCKINAAEDAALRTALIHVISAGAGAGALACVDLLLSAKADPNLADGSGATPLAWAAFTGDCKVATLLLLARADVNVRDSEGYTPLCEAAREKNIGMMLLLLSVSDIDVHATTSEGDASLLLRTGDLRDPADVPALDAVSTLLLVCKEAQRTRVELSRQMQLQDLRIQESSRVVNKLRASIAELGEIAKQQSRDIQAVGISMQLQLAQAQVHALPRKGSRKFGSI
jgi:hypothetical protein